MYMPTRQYVELVTDRLVERFLLRLFLRETRLRGLYIVSPYIAPMSSNRFSLLDLKRKVESEQTPTYVITQRPIEKYQQEAMSILKDSSWIEVRYNDSIHAKVYVASAEKESDSFALFGSANMTARSIKSNLEIGMLVYNEGPGREILRELHYWASVRLRTLEGSKLDQPIRGRRG
jgi:phosphatidylserine/phosphatidylglycerophosphate/cardiolipin synthase-like enzyme